jgi:hypothetical protein
MIINALTYGTLAFIGAYLFDSHDIHEMLFGFGMMLIAVIGYMIGDHLRRMAPVFIEFEKQIGKLDSKLSDLSRDVDSIERRLTKEPRV